MAHVPGTPDTSIDGNSRISGNESIQDSLSFIESSFISRRESTIEISPSSSISTEESIAVPGNESIQDSSSLIESSSIGTKESTTEISPVVRKSKKKIGIIDSDSSGGEGSFETCWNDTTTIEIKEIDGKELAFMENTFGKQSIRSKNDSVEKEKLLHQSQIYEKIQSSSLSREPMSELHSENIVNISSDDEYDDNYQIHNDSIITKKNVESVYKDDLNIEQCVQSLGNISITATKQEQLQVSDLEYKEQKNKFLTLQTNVDKSKNFMRSINLNTLPDKGDALLRKYQKLIEEMKIEEDKLNSMVITKEVDSQKILKPVSWENIEKQMGDVQPRTFGKQAMETLNIQKSLTLDRLEQLHGSLTNCPDSNTFATDPKGLNVELMAHQKHAVAWLIWREKQKPSGGILADDMGLGKTLTLISLILKCLQEHSAENDKWQQKTSKCLGGTLVVCPASLIYQWEKEIEKHVQKGLLTVSLHHGASRETNPRRLARRDVVITTYGIALTDDAKDGPLYQIKWRRIVLDEGHQIRNHKTQQSVAVCNLSAKSRWVLTGTPVHNKELDIYALLKFLRCTPFDDLAVWKRWISNKTTGGQDRLRTVISSLILRRTKKHLEEQKILTCLPKKETKLIEITLQKEEMNVYQKVLIFSRSLFAQFLHQRAEKNSDGIASLQLNDPNSEYYKMHQHLIRVNRVKNIKQHEILVLLLRLRQICCHPSLITKMLHDEDDLGAEGQDELDLLEQLNALNINDLPTSEVDNQTKQDDPTNSVGLAKASRGVLNPDHPVFAETYKSAKVRAIMKLLGEIPVEDKIIIVSQWSKLLSLMSFHLKKGGMKIYQLDGSVPANKRMEMLEKFNNSSCEVRVLLLSLTAGGVGLNLIGANHLILIDIHWNPQLELQAQDRIYRVGQTKAVNIYKLMVADTIEQRIKNLQERKLNMATELLTGARIQQNQLSLNDLKMLFNL